MDANNGVIAIIGYNRPLYFSRLMASLITNKEMFTMPVRFCIDGGGKADGYKEIIKSYERKYNIQNWEVIEQKINMGVGLHLFRVREQLLRSEEFDYVIVIEDDVVCSPHFLHTTNQLLAWSTANYDNVPVVSAWSLNFLSVEEKKKNLRYVLATNDHWITYAMTKQGWNAIRDIVQEYCVRFLNSVKYKQRNSAEIKKWIAEKVSEITPHDFNSPFPGKVVVDVTKNFPTSQDGIIAAAFNSLGYVKVNTKVNRCLYIGEIGEHGTREIYKNKRYGEMTLGTYAEDQIIRDFIPMTTVWKNHKTEEM